VFPGVGVGVGVVVPVGVGAGVGVDVGVDVGVGVPEVIVILNDNVHAEAAAWGCCCGTVGATCFVWDSFPLVKITRAASPIVRMTTMNKYQCFFI
jgi:hypothetical protein